MRPYDVPPQFCGLVRWSRAQTDGRVRAAGSESSGGLQRVAVMGPDAYQETFVTTDGRFYHAFQWNDARTDWREETGGSNKLGGMKAEGGVGEALNAIADQLEHMLPPST